MTAHVLFLGVSGAVKPTSLYLVAGLETYELFVCSCSWIFEVAEHSLFLEVSCKTKKLIVFAGLKQYELLVGFSCFVSRSD